jgi:hypothetical protein
LILRPLLNLSAALCVGVVLTGCNLIAPLANALLPLASIKLLFSCLPEHVRVDTPSGPRPVRELTAGDWVIGYDGRPVRVLQKHTYLENLATEFLILTFSDGAVVEVCAKHRVAGEPAGTLEPGDSVSGRTLVSVSRHSGETRSCDLLTEDAGYRISGVPVNSMIEEMNRAAVTGAQATIH